MFLVNIIFSPIRWILSSLLGLVLLVLLGIALAGFYVPFLMEKFVTYRSDYPLTIEQAHMNLFFGEIDFWDMTLENPKRFQEPILGKIKDLSLHVSPFGLMKPIKVVERFALDLSEVNWVKTANGEVNIDSFMESFQSAKSNKSADKKPEASKNEPATIQKAEEPVRFLIKTFILTIGKVRRIDYSQGKPKMMEYPVDIHLELKDVQSVNDILGPLSLALAKSSVSFLTNTLVDGLPVDIKEASQGVIEGSSSLFEKASGAIKSLF